MDGRNGSDAKPGPLAGLTIVEMAGLGPAPLAALMFSTWAHRSCASSAWRAAGQSSLPPDHDLDRHGRSILKLDHAFRCRRTAGRRRPRRDGAGAPGNFT
jgi:alpha-methylacyl-CoA racemase